MRLFGKKQEEKPDTGISKTRLLLGAAGLLLFIVGVKRSYRLDDPTATELRDGSAPLPPPPLPVEVGQGSEAAEETATPRLS